MSAHSRMLSVQVFGNKHPIRSIAEFSVAELPSDFEKPLVTQVLVISFTSSHAVYSCKGRTLEILLNGNYPSKIGIFFMAISPPINHNENK